MFLLNIQEALGINHNDTLDSSLALIYAMLEEYSYKCKERNREDNSDENGEFEWIELPSWDNPGDTVRMKMYKDVGSFL